MAELHQTNNQTVLPVTHQQQVESVQTNVRHALMAKIYSKLPMVDNVAVPHSNVPADSASQGKFWRATFSDILHKAIVPQPTSWEEYKGQLPQWASTLLTNVKEIL